MRRGRRKATDYFLVDTDAYVTETAFWPEILAMIDNDVIRQQGFANAERPGTSICLRRSTTSRGISASARLGPHSHRPEALLARKVEKKGTHHFVGAGATLNGRARPRLSGGVSDADADARHASAAGRYRSGAGSGYNKVALSRTILPQDNRLKGMIDLPFQPHAGNACVEEVKKYATSDSITRSFGRLSATSRASQQLHAALLRDDGESGKPFPFHSGFNWNDPSFLQLNRSISCTR